MEECIFCKIANGEIPTDIIYEDEKVLAFLDIRPYAEGHLLIIPREHSRWLWDMKDEDYSHLMIKVKNLANVLKKAFGIEWVEEFVAGEDIEHTHVHLLPRRDGDGLWEFPTKELEPKPSEERMKEIAKKIRAAIQ
jgi:histidine triad (HIT) family protein